MREFPDFMKNPKNQISSNYQSNNIEGYVFDGKDGSQMAFWTCYKDGKSCEHVHDYDEYFIVIEGQYNLIINGKKIELKAGEEFFIEKDIPHSGEFFENTRTIHAFGGKRAKRKKPNII